MENEFDFSGYATRNDIKCSDGRIIRHNAFKHHDGQVVPLVWQHQHEGPTNILGHVVLENRDDGVYAFGKFNSSEEAQAAKLRVEHKDLTGLSIYANQLRQQGDSVIHGSIREVSLVIAGANPGAFIDNVVLAHSEDGSEILSDTEAFIYFAEDDSLEYIDHSSDDKGDIEDMEDVTVEELFETFSEVEKDVVYEMLAHAVNGDMESAQQASDILSEVLDEDQAQLVDAMLENAIEMSEEDEEEDTDGAVEHAALGGLNSMKKNLFDKSTHEDVVSTLSHSELSAINSEAHRLGSYKQAFIEHAQTYGIENIDILFPDAKALANDPTFIARDMEWVSGVLSGTKHTPFSRIKTVAADITADEARAKGYVKGSEKKDEIFKLLSRITTPTTIYKKQKLDRDDVIDIVDLNVVAWLKAEMRVMLNEELARAILVGDGREVDDTDKINEDHIRPIYKDAAMYSHRVTIDEGYDVDALIDSIIRSRKEYKGKGTPTLYTTTDVLNDILLAKDKVGRRLYPTVGEVKSLLRVANIVEVPVMEGLKTTVDEVERSLVAIMVNLSDYSIGTDKGGEVSMFDDFDIDFNQLKYLMETRCSGALTNPKTAVIIESVVSAAEPEVPVGE